MEHDFHHQIPAGFRRLENQVAGHTFTDQSPSLGMLKQDDSGCVLKPLGKPECGKRELSFYERLQVSKEPTLIKLKMLVPKFEGKVKLIVNQQQHNFMKLEDITHNMEKPCVMDIKIGRRTWDPLATFEKRRVEGEKYAECKNSIGVCLPGFQLYSPNDDVDGYTFIRHGKEYGKQLDELGFSSTIRLFLNSQQTVCRPLVEEVLRQLYSIRSWFSSQTFFHFYASSILLAYDATILREKCIGNGAEMIQHNRQMPSEEGGTKAIYNLTHHVDIRNFVKVRMIDFAHVFPAEDVSLDSNYLFGLRSLITILEDLLQK